MNALHARELELRLMRACELLVRKACQTTAGRYDAEQLRNSFHELAEKWADAELAVLGEVKDLGKEKSRAALAMDHLVAAHRSCAGRQPQPGNVCVVCRAPCVPAYYGSEPVCMTCAQPVIAAVYDLVRASTPWPTPEELMSDFKRGRKMVRAGLARRMSGAYSSVLLYSYLLTAHDERYTAEELLNFTVTATDRWVDRELRHWCDLSPDVPFPDLGTAKASLKESLQTLYQNHRHVRSSSGGLCPVCGSPRKPCWFDTKPACQECVKPVHAAVVYLMNQTGVVDAESIIEFWDDAKRDDVKEARPA